MKKVNVYEIPEAPGVFIDACITNQFKQLIFASLWGRTTAIQSLIARITVADIPSITVNNEHVLVDKEMIKKVGKLPSNNHYGEMMHALIYQKTTIEDNAGRRDLIFIKDTDERLIYQTVQSMSSLPLMNHWEQSLTNLLKQKDMINDLITVCGYVQGISICLSNEDTLSSLISEKIKSCELSVSVGV